MQRFASLICTVGVFAFACYRALPTDPDLGGTGGGDTTGEEEGEPIGRGAETGEGGGDDGSEGTRFDVLIDNDVDVSSFCGDGEVTGDEQCDTALDLVQPCFPAPGMLVCRADCTWDTQYCECTPGQLGCVCDDGDCESGASCDPSGPPLCVAECVALGNACTAADTCCSGTCGPTDDAAGDICH